MRMQLFAYCTVCSRLITPHEFEEHNNENHTIVFTHDPAFRPSAIAPKSIVDELSFLNSCSDEVCVPHDGLFSQALSCSSTDTKFCLDCKVAFQPLDSNKHVHHRIYDGEDCFLLPCGSNTKTVAAVASTTESVEEFAAFHSFVEVLAQDNGESMSAFNNGLVHQVVDAARALRSSALSHALVNALDEVCDVVKSFDISRDFTALDVADRHLYTNMYHRKFTTENNGFLKFLYKNNYFGSNLVELTILQQLNGFIQKIVADGEHVKVIQRIGDDFNIMVITEIDRDQLGEGKRFFRTYLGRLTGDVKMSHIRELVEREHSMVENNCVSFSDEGNLIADVHSAIDMKFERIDDDENLTYPIFNFGRLTHRIIIDTQSENVISLEKMENSGPMYDDLSPEQRVWTRIHQKSTFKVHLNDNLLVHKSYNQVMFVSGEDRSAFICVNCRSGKISEKKLNEDDYSETDDEMMMEDCEPVHFKLTHTYVNHGDVPCDERVEQFSNVHDNFSVRAFSARNGFSEERIMSNVWCYELKDSDGKIKLAQKNTDKFLVSKDFVYIGFTKTLIPKKSDCIICLFCDYDLFYGIYDLDENNCLYRVDLN